MEMMPLMQDVVRRAMGSGTLSETQKGGLQRLVDAAAFEVTAALPVLGPLAERAVGRASLVADYAFLPASTTWVEWAPDGGRNRIGILASDGAYDDRRAIYLAVAVRNEDRLIDFHIGPAWIDGDDIGLAEVEGECDASFQLRLNQAGTFFSVLSAVNAPRAFGRTDHAPHRGLMKTLARAGIRPPTKAWQEIVLDREEGSAPGSLGEAGAVGGKKARHFVRSHLRFRLSQWERVTSHWRGDASLGRRPTAADYILR